MPNYTLPPGYVFSIWGIIYLGFLLFSLFELTPNAGRQSKFANARSFIVLSIFLNLLWVAFVGFDLFVIPFLLQWIMLAISIVILFQIKKSIHPVRSRFEKVLIAAFSLYAGWLTVAIITFTAEILLVSGWNGGIIPPQTWASVMFMAASLIIFVAYKKLGFIWYMFPLIWAFAGIAFKFNGVVSITASALAALGLVYFIIEFISIPKAQPFTQSRSH
jgi:hypothetical protein